MWKLWWFSSTIGMMFFLKHAVPPRQNLYGEYYCSFVRNNLRIALRKNCDALCITQPTFSMTMIGTYIRSCDWFGQSLGPRSSLLSPYSRDLITCDFYLIPKMKEPLSGTRFRTFKTFFRQSILSLNSQHMRQFQRLPHYWQHIGDNSDGYNEGQ